MSVIDLGLHPLCDDLISINSKNISVEYPIEILFCSICYTAFQKYQVNREKLFPSKYHYRSRMTGSVLSGMVDLVEDCKSHFGSLVGLKILDVGCNDGSLLNFFKAEGAHVLGIEPTDAANDSIVPVIKDYFDRHIIEQILNTLGVPDIIVFTNVFAHIENLPNLIANLLKIMDDSTVLVIENHYLGAVLKYGQFDTFYHEHPRTYSSKSFDFIAKSMDREVIRRRFVSRYGGNIRVFIGKSNQNNSQFLVEPEIEDYFLKSFTYLNRFKDSWIIDKKLEIEELNELYGPIPAKAFPGRAAILVRLLNLSEFNISAVFEITGSIKVGHYVPGTRIPINPEVELFNNKNTVPVIINLAWHIPVEVEENLRLNGYSGKIINIIDFKEISS
jgi:hypothetical protein